MPKIKEFGEATEVATIGSAVATNCGIARINRERQGEDVMGRNEKKAKNSKNRLQRGKKIEARKPLDVPVHPPTTTTNTSAGENLSLNFSKIEYKYN
jgi:hypothetical protein